MISSGSPASTASRNRRIAVLTADLTDLLRRRRFSLVLTRLICDLMLATRLPLAFLCRRRSARRWMAPDRCGPAGGSRRAFDTPGYQRARVRVSQGRVKVGFSPGDLGA